MAYLQRIQLSGIRSFDPSSLQSLVFYRPLTIILGKNGSGKTTIIESLLNATTGEMPPGASAATDRSSFIYDPKVLNETEVKGQIRLVFNTRTHAQMQVIRSFAATQGRTGKTIFSTLDSMIAFKDEATGKVTSNTYRAGDVDNMVPELLGVTRPVLEHVVFCHQEECNWPLGPSSDVKKKFDELFASTKYVAALEKLRDKAKQYRLEMKEMEQALGTMREQREQAKSMREEVKAKEDSLKAFQARMDDMAPLLAFYETVVDTLQHARNTGETLQQDNATLRGRIDEQDRSMARLGLGRDPKESLAELRTFRGKIENELVDGNAKKQTSQDGLRACEARLREADKLVNDCRLELRLAEARHEETARRVQELQSIVASLPDDLRPPVPASADGGAAPHQLMDAAALVELEAKLTQRLAQVRRDAAANADALRVFNEQVAGERARLHRAMDADGKERELKAQQAKVAQKKAADLRRRLPASGGSNDEQVEAAQREIDHVQRRIQEYMQQQGGVQQSRHEAQRELEALTAQVNAAARAREVLRDDMRLYSGVRDGVATLQTLKATADDHLRKRVQEPLSNNSSGGKVQQAAAALLKSAAASLDSKAAREAEKLAQMLKDERSRASAASLEERRHAEENAARVQRRLEDERNVLQKAEKELAAKTATLATEGAGVGAAALEQTLAAEEERLRKVTSDVSDRKSALECFQQYIDVAQRESKCSVCERDFEGGDAAEFISAKQRELASAPTEIKSLQEQKTALEKRVAALRKLQPTATRIHELNDRVLPDARASISELDGQLHALRAALESAQGEAVNAEKQLTSAQALLGEAQRGVHNFNDYDARSRQLGTATLTPAAKTKLQGLVPQGSMTPENIEAAVKTMEREVKALDDEMSDKQHRCVVAQRQVAAAGNEKPILENELLQKQNALMRIKQQADQCKDIVRDATAAEAEYEEADQRIKELDRRRKEFEKELADINNSAAGKLRELNMVREDLSAQEQRLSKCCGALSAGVKSLSAANNTNNNNKFPAGKKYESLEGARAAFAAAQQQHATADSDVRNSRVMVDTVVRGMAGMHSTLDTIKLQTQYREMKEQRNELQAAYASNEKKLKTLMDDARQEALAKARQRSGSDEKAAREGEEEMKRCKTVDEMRDRCRRRIAELEKSKASWEGAMSTVKADVAERKAQLEKEKYKEVDKRYTTSFIKYQSLDIAVADVDKFYKALERAVSSYHSEKIAQINKIVADLWRATYRGSDIDSIEIKSEDDGTAASGASASSTARRSYKYRVVMKKGGSELDMRGRCSAGQKVLASVIIRLALSEAFCCECGILALDEPTTNLDTENAKALAQALHEIIEVRRNSMQHFQLIIITHDDEFVRLLGARGKDRIYFVDKSRDGAFSVITEKSYEDLFS